jgi:hypothetical protein
MKNHLDQVRRILEKLEGVRSRRLSCIGSDKDGITAQSSVHTIAVLARQSLEKLAADGREARFVIYGRSWLLRSQ